MGVWVASRHSSQTCWKHPDFFQPRQHAVNSVFKICRIWPPVTSSSLQPESKLPLCPSLCPSSGLLSTHRVIPLKQRSRPITVLLKALHWLPVSLGAKANVQPVACKARQFSSSPHNSCSLPFLAVLWPPDSSYPLNIAGMVLPLGFCPFSSHCLKYCSFHLLWLFAFSVRPESLLLPFPCFTVLHTMDHFQGVGIWSRQIHCLELYLTHSRPSMEFRWASDGVWKRDEWDTWIPNTLWGEYTSCYYYQLTYWMWKCLKTKE